MKNVSITRQYGAMHSVFFYGWETDAYSFVEYTYEVFANYEELTVE